MRIMLFFKCTLQWFLVYFTILCNHHHYVIPEHSRHSKKKPSPHQQSLGIPLLSPWQSQICFLSLDLPILDVSYKWDHTLCGLWRLASFIQQNINLHSQATPIIRSTGHHSVCHSFWGGDIYPEEGVLDFMIVLFLIFFFFFGCATWLTGSQYPDQGSNPGPWQWEHRVPTTRPPRNSLKSVLNCTSLILSSALTYFI